jgi:archaemetzincin
MRLACRLLVCLAALLLVAAAPTPGPPGRLYIQPLGKELPEADVALVKEALHALYGLDLGMLPRVELPREAHYRPTGRYRAEKLLDFLNTRVPADGYRILGLTGVDISTTKGKYHDWGILGLATIDGKACVISSKRCHRGARNALHARQRLGKVAAHEIGHTLGLPHCPTVGCLMEDARGTVATTDREYDLCPRCRTTLRESGQPIKDDPKLPWPRP